MKRYMLLVAVTVVVCGCKSTPRQAAPGAPGMPPGPGVAPPANPFAPPAPPAPVGPGGSPFAPPGAVPFNPQPGTNGGFPPGSVPPGSVPPGNVVPGGGAPPAPVFPSTSNLPSREMQIDYRWQPGPATPSTGSVFLMPPEPIVTEERKSDERKTDESKSEDRNYRPTPEPPLLKGQGNAPRLSIPEPVKPEPTKEQPKAPGLPVGIPGFASVTERVASGLRPSLDEGLDWLKSNGYHTVLFVRAPDEDDSADRKQVEKRGMKYLSMGLSPLSVTTEVVDGFNRIVSDSSNYPLFVYDRDGSLAGSLWYLHFRTSEQATDDGARVRAGRLGLRDDADGPHRLMWLAIQKYLSER